tara:strand:+ start:1325 stop:1651 length:327 start_codon:yes stop_codon:yes gene_type:complete
MVNGKKSQLTTKSDKTLLKNCCSCGQKSKFSSMYHNSKELGLRLVHSPTKIEEIDFNLKTAELNIFEDAKKFKALRELCNILRDHNILQQKLIDENRVRIQQLEEKLK